MDPQLGRHPSPDSLKRKRADLEEDDTPGPERDGLLEKKNKVESDEADLTNTASDAVDTAEGLIDADDAHTHLPFETATADTNSTKTDTADATAEAASIPSKPTLQTLPRELRDMVYEYVAETEERIVLGRRMVEARRANSTWTLDKCFDEAVALHPLSMTCRQFRDEFQDVHFSASEPYWILLVNNFDIEQLQIFSDWIQSEEFVKVLRHYGSWSEPEWDHDEPMYDQNVSLRFQMDARAGWSASKLCEHVYFEQRGDAPSSLADHDTSKIWLGIPEIIARYVPRTTTPAANRRSMTLQDAKEIKSMLEGVENTILDMPAFEPCLGGGKFDGATQSCYYMEYCWFQEFYACVNAWTGSREAKQVARGTISRSFEMHAILFLSLRRTTATELRGLRTRRVRSTTT